MSAATPLFALPYPTPSDPLKDAVEAIPRALAQHVESALASFGGVPAPGSWQNPALSVGTNYGPGYRAVQYRKVGTDLEGRGVLGGLGGGLAPNTAIYTLPVGFRPTATDAVPTLVGAAPAQLEITNGGVVRIAGAVPANVAVLLYFRIHLD